MSPIDAAWYRMDRPANPAVVTGILLLDASIDRSRIKAVFAERLLAFERFRYRVAETGWPWTVPHWERDPHFSLDAHLRSRTCPAPGSKEALLRLIGDLTSQPLNPHRPLWDAYVIDNVGCGSALAMRFHHCMADGTGAIALAKHLLDPAPPASDSPSKKPDTQEDLPSTLPSYTSTLERLTDSLDVALGESVHSLRHPLQTISRVPEGVAGLGVAAASVIQPADPATPLRGDLTGVQRVAHSEPLPVDAVKAVGAPFDATVNDVLIAATAGALRTYLQHLHVRPDDYPIRAIVPVDLRSPDEALELGNAFGLTFLTLPLDEADPLDRLRATKREMDAIKRSPEARVFFNILKLFGQLPRSAEDWAAPLFASKATVVLTNVKGPSETHTLAGCPVENMIFWVPHPVSLGIGISILSYNNRLTVGVITDAGLVDDPETITQSINHEFDQLVDQV